MQFELHGFTSFDELLAFHCAPALAGIKPANLVSCPTASMPVVSPLLAEYTRRFADRGIAFEVLCHCAARTLILVYQPQQLEALLAEQEASEYLQEIGYKAGSARSLLRQLGAKVSCSRDFPHEIGIFLGYRWLISKALLPTKAVTASAAAIGKYMMMSNERKACLTHIINAGTDYCRL